MLSDVVVNLNNFQDIHSSSVTPLWVTQYGVHSSGVVYVCCRTYIYVKQNFCDSILISTILACA